METTPNEHRSDVRGKSDPYEPSDGVTLRRIISLVMLISVAMLIFASVALGLFYKREAAAARAANTAAAVDREALAMQLQASTQAITDLLKAGEGGDAARSEALKSAVAQVVAAQQKAIEAQFAKERTASAGETAKLLAELKRLQNELAAKIERIIAPPGPAGPAGTPGTAGPPGQCKLLCL